MLVGHERGHGNTAERPNAFAVGFESCEQSPGGLDGLLCSLRHAFREKREPAFPVVFDLNCPINAISINFF